MKKENVSSAISLSLCSSKPFPKKFCHTGLCSQEAAQIFSDEDRLARMVNTCASLNPRRFKHMVGDAERRHRCVYSICSSSTADMRINSASLSSLIYFAFRLFFYLVMGHIFLLLLSSNLLLYAGHYRCFVVKSWFCCFYRILSFFLVDSTGRSV